jgi:hypothetical protein
VGTLTKNDVIEYLVKKKYPKILHNQQSSTQEVEDYRAKLNALNDNDVGLIYNEVLSKAREEQETREKVIYEAKLKSQMEERDTKLFGLPHMQADLTYWSKMTTWDKEAFVALAFGKEPKFINWDYIERFSPSPFVDEYSKLRDLVLNATVSPNRLFHKDKPINFANWAKHYDIALPEKLVELVKKYNTEQDWYSECRKLQSQLEEVTQQSSSTPAIEEKPLHAKERDSIYKMLAAALAETYGRDEIKKRNVKANEILDDLLAKHGIELDEDTVRKHLRNAAKYLE